MSSAAGGARGAAELPAARIPRRPGARPRRRRDAARRLPGLPPEGELSRRLSELVRRETCADVAVAWDVGPSPAARRRRRAVGRPPQPADPGGRLRGAHRRRLPRRRLRRRQGPRSSAPSATRMHGAAAAAARPQERCCRNGRRGAGCRRRSTRSSSEVGPDHAPRFSVEVAVEHGSTSRAGRPAIRKRGAPNRTPPTSLLLREGVWTEDAAWLSALTPTADRAAASSP